MSTFKNSNELIVKLNQYFILAFVAEVGDYDHGEHGDGAGYLSEFKFCPKQVVRCVMIVKQTFGLVSKGFNLQNLVLHILHKMASRQNESADICVDGR